MARQLRIQYEDAIYHVLSRGNDRQNIFYGDNDYKLFTETLKESAETHQVNILAFALMPNHYHLIVKTPKANISAFMKHFSVSYSVRFNNRHKRVGHLFQGRYKSIIVEKDSYLSHLSAYIHLNPIRTKYFSDKPAVEKLKFLKSYNWSTLPGYLSDKKKLGWIDYSEVLSVFRPSNRKSYAKYIMEHIASELASPFEKVTHQMILGSPDFANEIKEKFLRTDNDTREVPSGRSIKSLCAEMVIDEIANYFNVEKEDILKPRNGSARQIAMDMIYRYSNITQKEIGTMFENIDYSSVSQNRRRLKAKLKEDKKLLRDWENIAKRLEECQM